MKNTSKDGKPCDAPHATVVVDTTTMVLQSAEDVTEPEEKKFHQWSSIDSHDIERVFEAVRNAK